MLKEFLENTADRYYEDIIHILKSNNEQYTENNTGFFFDLTKLKEDTIKDLKSFMQGKPNDEAEKEHKNFFTQQQSYITKEKSSTVEEIKMMNTSKSKVDITNGTSITPSQKFISEYNVDFNKTTEKASTLLKFLNARKKYIRNAETLLSKNEVQLMKQPYIL